MLALYHVYANYAILFFAISEYEGVAGGALRD